jgi:hypothetical protein
MNADQEKLAQMVDVGNGRSQVHEIHFMAFRVVFGIGLFSSRAAAFARALQSNWSAFIRVNPRLNDFL